MKGERGGVFACSNTTIKAEIFNIKNRRVFPGGMGPCKRYCSLDPGVAIAGNSYKLACVKLLDI